MRWGATAALAAGGLVVADVAADAPSLQQLQHRRQRELEVQWQWHAHVREDANAAIAPETVVPPAGASGAVATGAAAAATKEGPGAVAAAAEDVGSSATSPPPLTGTAAAVVTRTPDPAVDPAAAASAAVTPPRPENFYCRFDNFRCKPEVLAARRWRSCCRDPACPEHCSSGLLRPDSRILLVGNSHMGELAEAILCQNAHMLSKLSFTPNLDKYANARIMIGLPPPPLVTWTYDARRDVLRNAKGELVKGGHLPDSVVAYEFSNGAKLFSVTNTPMQLIAGRGEDPLESPFSLQGIAAHLGFEWPQLTAVLFNEGNFRFWAYRLWCDKVDAAIQAAAAAGTPYHNGACPGLLDKQRERGCVVDLPHFVENMAEAGFRGRAVLVRQLMQDTQGAAPPPPMDVSAAPTQGKFNLKFYDWTYSMNGRLCAVPNCWPLIDHQCLPGPPDDLARIALHYLQGGE